MPKEKSGSNTSKRSSKRARISEPAAEAIQQPSLPTSSLVSSTGNDNIYAIWEEKWQQLHGDEDLSPEIKHLVNKFSECVVAVEDSKEELLGKQLEEAERDLKDVKALWMKAAENLLKRQNVVDDIEERLHELVQNSQGNNELVKEVGELLNRAIEHEKRAEKLVDYAQTNVNNAELKYNTAISKVEEEKAGIQQYIETANAAKEEVNQLLGIFTNPAVKKIHILSPLRLMVPFKGSRPSLHDRPYWYELPRCSFDSSVSGKVEAYRDATTKMRSWKTFESIPVVNPMYPSRMEDPVIHNESCINKFFEHELCPRIKSILNVSDPLCEFFAIEGDHQYQADFFLVLKLVSPRNPGCCLYSAVVVELKLPYDSKERDSSHKDSVKNASGPDKWKMDCEFPRSRFAHLGLKQAYNFMYDEDNLPRAELRGMVNRKYAVLSNQHQYWYAMADPTGETDSEGKEVVELKVSRGFWIDNDHPHPVAAFAWLLSEVVKDMIANPDDYVEYDNDRLTSSKISHRSKTGTRSRRSGNSGSRNGPQSSGAPSSGRTHASTKGKGASGGGSRHTPRGHRGTNQKEMEELYEEYQNLASVAILSGFSEEDVLSLSGGNSSSSSNNNNNNGSGGTSRTISACVDWNGWKGRWQPIQGSIKIGELLGTGRTGTVCRGELDGQEMAIKLCNLGSKAKIICELDQEVRVYDHLKELQGKSIPQLKAHGLVKVEKTLFAALILELIEDDLKTLGSRRADAIHNLHNDSTKQMVINILDQIHGMGVVQGDARPQNILFQRGKDGELVPRLIDFAFGKIGATIKEQADEMDDWKKVLGIN